MAAGVIMSLSLEADTWRKANNYFYGQFTFKVHRNLTYIALTGKQTKKKKQLLKTRFLKLAI